MRRDGEQKILEKEVCSHRGRFFFKGAKEPSRVNFTLTHDNPYPAGDYKIDIYLNDELAETVEFKIN